MAIPAIRRSHSLLWLVLAASVCLAGLSPGAADAQSIRVLLSGDISQIEVRPNGPLWLTEGKGQGRAITSPVQITVAKTGFLLNKVRLKSERFTLHAGDQGLTLILPTPPRASNGHVAIAGKTELPVTGLVHLMRKGNGFLVINQVDLEEYVKGVVPSEVSSTWHPEMLKAQAVAARTYALYQQMLSPTREYDVVATVQDQVYRGTQGVDAAILRAVEETRGLVMTYQDAPIYAAFSSTAAGLTEDAVNVWSKDYPYLKGVECPFDVASPFYQWKASFTLDSLERNLRHQGFPLGKIMSLTPSSYTRGGRVATLRILHSEGELLLRGEELRKAAGYMIVPSTQFTIDSIGQEIVLSGYGAGHAVGMCQWGAKELAEIGYSFSTILAYYYPGTELKSMSLTKAPTPPAS